MCTHAIAPAAPHLPTDMPGHVSRRRPLILLTVVLAMVWAAAPASSGEPEVPRAVDFEQRVPQPAAAARTGHSAHVMPAVRAPGRFDLVGFKWDDERDLEMEIRVRHTGEPWGRWVSVGTADSAPGGTDPVWAGGADEYQLRLSRRPQALRAHFVNATGTRTPADRARTQVRRSVDAALAAVAGEPAAAADMTGAPGIVAREEWEGGQCQPRDEPEQGTVDMGVVHHTVSANHYGPDDTAAMVLAICRYHRNANGWDDIGYNFVVDRFGRVFEGRAGGVDKPIVGAHAQGYNDTSTGVANLGTFSDLPQSAAGVRATARLLAWKLNLHGTPVTGPVSLTSRGGGQNRHPAGAEVAFERISTHRDANHTDCPGQGLLAQLPEIRRLAVEHAATLPPPPPPPAPPAPGEAAASEIFPAKLQVARARVLRRHRELDLLAPITRRADGQVDITFRAAGQSLVFRGDVDSANGRVRLRRSISAAQARLGTGIVTISYPGNARTRAQRVRLRAASRKAELRTSRPSLIGDRVVASGTVTRRARGVVRVQLDFMTEGRQRVIAFRAPIRNGRWRLDARLAASDVAAIEARAGSLHSYILYTGYLPQRVRGEMRSLRVAG